MMTRDDLHDAMVGAALAPVLYAILILVACL
jgi:hypothetical protein